MKKNVSRLLGNFEPHHYAIDLTINQDTLTFEGTVVIEGKKVDRPSQRLTFHQKELTFSSALITRHDKKGDVTYKVDRINRHKGYEQVRLHTTEKLMPGTYTVTLTYTGKITHQMEGIYPCTFTHEGVEKRLIATQFESHHAREVIPCIDEPEAKATFALTLTTNASDTVVSNTPIVSEKVLTDSLQKVTKFAKTPRMSTYLLAFVCGEMGMLQSKTKRGIQVRTFATPDNVPHLQFALDTAVKCLDYYEDYFAIEYPLEKCDLIALPDFASGAMENWGCITFREHALIVDPSNTSLSSKQYVAMVIAHELAHQWFGNLVTMRWWTDLWLNEGFASWIEYLAVDELFPDWKMWTQFIIDEQQQALKLDALENTHPIEVPINHPDEIRSIFDAISYNKGASVIHMLYSYLGAKDFQTGLRYYLKKHAYGNTDTADLWSALEEASEKPVKDFMHSWTSMPGYPLVKADVTDNSVSLKQERFFTNPSHSDLPSQLWPLPLQAGTDELPDLMTTPEETYTLHDTHEFKINRNHGGFYRVVYNSTHIDRLGRQIKKGHLGPIDRLGLLIDLTEAAKAGHTDTVDVLHFLKNFSDEDSYVVWDAIAQLIGSIRVVMDDDDVRESMKPFIRKLVKPQVKRLGWNKHPKEAHFDTLLRPIVLGLAASADEEEIVKHCYELFDDIESNEIDPDLRGVVFGTVARLGNEDTFAKLVRLHNKTQLSEERITLAAAITNFKQLSLINKSLEMIDSKDVRLQDVAYWIVYSFMNRHAKKATWEWMKNNWSWLHDNLGNDLSFYRLPIYASRAFTGDRFLAEFKEFFKPRLSPSMERSFHQAVEMIQWQSAWRTRSLKEVKAFFNNQDQ